MKSMMIQPTKEELELLKKLDSAKNDEEREEIEQQLKLYLIEKNEKLKECPFSHKIPIL